MITINTLAINSDFTQISVDVSMTGAFGSGFYKALFYTKDTYKETPKAIDLSSKLVGGLNETFTINASDVNLTKFLGAFWVEFFAQEACNPVGIPGGGSFTPDPGDEECDGDKHERLGTVANMIGYKECALDKALSLPIQDCEAKDDYNAFAIQSLIEAFDLAYTQEYFEDSIKILKRLDALCKTCSTCPDYGNTVLVNGGSYQTANNSIILS